MSTVLVTGAAGFLGSACVRALVRRGERVVALVRDRDPRSPLYADDLAGRCVEVREELAAADRLLARYRPDTVLHLAAQSQVPEAGDEPLPTFESNVRGTWLLLEACRRAARPPDRILVASSDKAYGLAPPPYTEATCLDPRHPYDVSKAAADLLARCYALHFGLPVVVTRAANLYGPGDLHPDRLVPAACMALVRGDPLVLRSRGRMVREWLYVDDAAEACLLLAARAGTTDGPVFNLGSGVTATPRDVLDTLARAAGQPLQLVIPDADPPGELPDQRLDSTRLRALGWVPQTSLEAGLAATWAWYARFPW